MLSPSVQSTLLQHAGLRLRQLMQRKCVMLPGTPNGIAARLAAEVGYEGLYISGAALSALQGLPDIGFLGLEEFTKAISQVSSVTTLPVMADADTGFGGPEMVRRTVFMYNQAGAAGLHIEDQVFPKKCGHLDGKKLINIDEMERKIKAAVEASKTCSDGNFLVCARTDARSVEGMDAAVERAVRYVNAGADMIFPEGLQNETEFSAFAQAMAVLPGKAPFGGPYLLANMTEFGKTPLLNLSTFESLGYHCVIYPVSTVRIAMKAMKDLLVDLHRTGSVQNTVGSMYTRQELYDTLHYKPTEDWDYPSPSQPKKEQDDPPM